MHMAHVFQLIARYISLSSAKISRQSTHNSGKMCYKFTSLEPRIAHSWTTLMQFVFLNSIHRYIPCMSPLLSPMRPTHPLPPSMLSYIAWPHPQGTHRAHTHTHTHTHTPLSLCFFINYASPSNPTASFFLCFFFSSLFFSLDHVICAIWKQKTSQGACLWATTHSPFACSHKVQEIK